MDYFKVACDITRQEEERVLYRRAIVEMAQRLEQYVETHGFQSASITLELNEKAIRMAREGQ